MTAPFASLMAPDLKRRREGRWRLFYGLLALISLAATVHTVIQSLRHDVANSDECVWQNRIRNGDTLLIVGEMVEGGAADRAGVRQGDVVLAINGIAVENHALVKPPQELSTFAQGLLNNAPIDRDIPYVVERNGKILDLRIRLIKQITFIRFIPPLFAFLWLIVGVLVAMARPLGVVQRVFFLTGATVIFAWANWAGIYAMMSPITAMVLSGLWSMLGVGVFYPMWLLFCTMFPVRQEIFTTRPRRLLLFSIAIILGLLITARIIALSTFGWESDINVLLYRQIGEIADLFFLGASWIYYWTGIGFLWRGYRRVQQTRDKRPVQIIIVGSVLAGMVLMYIGVVYLTSGGAPTVMVLYPQFLFPILLILAQPIAFGYAIFTFQVMDFRTVLRTTLVYAGSMAAIALLYIGTAWMAGKLFSSLTSKEIEGPVAVISFVIFVMLFEPLKRRLQEWIENRFFPQRRNYSTALAEYGTRITETAGTRDVAALIATTLRQSLALRGTAVLAEDPITATPRMIARDCDFPPMVVDEDGLRKLQTLLSGTHALVSLETIDDARLEPLRENFSYAVGLHAGGRVIGIILLSRPDNGEPLSGSQTPFIASVTAQGAAALEVARMYERELERQRYQEELATARRIQESLLPGEMPGIPGIAISAASLPARAVGGDYYDVIPLDESRYLVVIADVSGKGLAASLYMAEFHGMVHVARSMHRSPREMLVTLNDHLFEVITRGSFISATTLLFDTERHTVTFARAGHTPIIRHSGSTVDTLTPAGVALGLCARALFSELLQEYTVRYEPGETFILYSDGVSEAMNERREEFGEGRLLDLISRESAPTAQALRDSIYAQVERFRGRAEQNDDLTIVVVKVEGSPSPSNSRPTVRHDDLQPAAGAVVPRR